MKHCWKRVLAVVLALAMAVPSNVLADGRKGSSDNTGQQTAVTVEKKTEDSGSVKGRNDVATVAYADGEGFEEFNTLEEAIAAAGTEFDGFLLGTTVTLTKDVTLTAPLEINKSITIEGNNKTISAGAAMNQAILVGSNDVTLQDLTVDGAGNAKHGIQAWHATGVVLENVTAKNGTGYGVLVNGSAVTAEGLNTSGNGWGGVNLDTSSDPMAATFTMSSGTLAEANSVVVENDEASIPVTLNISGGSFQGVGTNPNNNSGLIVGNVTGGTYAVGVEDALVAEGMKFDSASGTIVAANYVAEIGEGANRQRYESLTDAVAAAQNGDTIKLLNDVAENLVLQNKTLVLDLNGKTLTTDYIDAYAGDYTIQNGVVNGTVYANGLSTGETGKLTLAADTVINADYGVILYQAANNTGYGYTVDINGTVNGCVWVMGNIYEGDSVLNVRGTIDSPLDVGIALNGYATVNVLNGATVEAEDENGFGAAIEVRAGVLNVVDGATIIGHGEPVSHEPNGSGTTTVGAGIAVSPYDNSNITVNIEGGTIKGNAPLYIANTVGTANKTLSLNVSGGNFVTTDNGTKAIYADPSEPRAVHFASGGTFSSPVEEEHCAEGYIPKDNGDGTYTVKVGAYVAQVGEVKYETLEEAIAAANGAVITLLADAEYVLPAGETLKVNPNGKNFAINATEGYILYTSDPDENGVITYTSAIAVAKIGDNMYPSLVDAFAAAQSGDVVEVIVSEAELPATAVIPEGVTLKGKGTEATALTITTTNGSGIKITNPNVTIRDLMIDGKNITNGGYNTLINVRADGCVVDNVIMVNGGKKTWNSSILVETLPATATFTVKNSNISGAFRGVLRESCSANIVIENCEIDAIYPFNIDGGNGGTVTVSGSALHGWTSYSGVDKVTFTNCQFSKGNSGYDCVAAYVDTEFNGCTFDSTFAVYAQISPFNFYFNDCTKAGNAVTRDQFKEQFPDDPNVWEKCNTYVNGQLVGAVAQVGTVEYKTLQKALDAAHEMSGDVTVTLLTNITEVAVIRQKAGLNLTVDGADKTITGQLYIDGDGRYEGADTLVIKNIKFAYDAETYDEAFIDVPNTKTAGKPYTTDKYNYAHNVTVTDCEFAGEGTTTVAFRVASGAGANGVVLNNLTAAGGHSFAQLVGVKNLTITGCTVSGAKNGINISGGDGTATISGNTLLANASEDEGYTVRLKDGSGMQVTLSDNTFSGVEGIISKATGGGKIVIESGKYAGPLPTDGTKLTVLGGVFSVAPILAVCGEGLYPIANMDEATKEQYPYTVGVAVAVVDNVGYTVFTDAVAASDNGSKVITLLADIAEEYTLQSGMLQIAHNGKSLTVKAPEGYALTVTVEGDVTTYKVDNAVAEINGVLYPTLQAALDTAHEMSGDVVVTLLADIAEYAIVHQKAGLNLVINGAGKTVTGQIIVDGDGRSTGTETLVISGIHFQGTQSDFCSGTDAFVIVPSTKTAGTPYYTGKYNYAHNITVSNCSFTSTSTAFDVVGFKSNSGAGAYNVTLNAIEGTNLHSLAQFTGTTGATITACTVLESESFININGGGGAYNITSCTFTSAEGADGYGVRLKANSSAVVTVDDSTFEAKKAFVIGKNDATDGQINIGGGLYKGEVALAKSGGTGKYNITGGFFDYKILPEYCGKDDQGNQLYPVICDDEERPYTVGLAVALVDGLGYQTFAAAATAAAGTMTIKLLADITDAYEMSADEVLIVEKGDFSLTVNAPEGYILSTETVEGITTYSLKKGVAKIGDTLYASLVDAVVAVPTDGTATTITMIDNEAINVVGSAITIASGKNVTIDLNGYQVVGTAGQAATSALITNRGTLTIKDSSAEGTGKLISGATDTWIYDGDGNYAGSYASNTITNCGTVTVESGHIENISTGSATYAIDNNSSGANAIANITGGTVKAHSVAIRQFANSTTYENTVIISGGTVTAGYSGIWVQLPGSDASKAMKATLNVTGGTLHGGSYAFYDYTYGNSFANTQYTLSGGTFEGDIFSFGANITIEDGIYTGDVAINQGNAPSNVSVTGGYFSGDVYTYSTYASEEFITGGYFATTTYEYEGATYDCDWMSLLHHDYKYVDNEDPATKDDYPYVIAPKDYVAQINDAKFESLEVAFAAAVDGDTIKLLKDCSGNGIVVPEGKFTQGLTIDFDGHTYDFSGHGVGSTGTEYNGFQLLKDNTITFKNGTITATSEDA
ncbi:MAG: right-handed parallel beta-helix repeat-containing protein, partial [Lachnospiraceae bacterium]|nr:right-handed parallel beta-helix repeat-containing protein [Lachnospiraceae bacterium]